LTINVSIFPPALNKEFGSLDLSISPTVGGLIWLAGFWLLSETVTITAVEATDVPPLPTQVRLNVLVLLKVLVEAWPDIGLSPFQSPEALHDLAPCAFHVSIEDCPALTDGGEAENEIVGIDDDNDDRFDEFSLEELTGVNDL
jgi:hypothetical protein